METKTAPTGQQADPTSSRAIAAKGADVAALLNELFNDPESGAYVIGVIVAIEDPEKREGVNDKGRKYSFCNRRMQLQTKDGALVCAESHDTLDEFKPIDMYKRVKWKITRARMDGSQMVFNVIVA